MIEAVADRPGVRAPDRRRVRRRPADRRPGGAAPLPGRDRGRRSGRRARTSTSTLGRGEMRAGRSLESLLSAYRIGARVAWRRFAARRASQAGLEPDTLYLLAESIFAYIDVLSAESAEGHALEQSAAAGEAELRRRRLVRMLVREPPAEPGAVERAAAEAGWPLPRTPGGAGDRRTRGASRVASRLPRGDDRARRSASAGARWSPTPTGPGGAPRSSGRSPTPARAPGSGTTVDWAQRRGRASPGRGRRWSWRTGAGADRGPRAAPGELLLRSDHGARRRARRRPAGAAGRAVAGLSARG